MKKLFYEDPYLKEWESEITEIIEKDNKYYVSLRETALYPEGGGQPSDYGEIDGIKVTNSIEENNKIYHILEAKPSNKVVKCKLDFERRFDLMQQHTGQHLLSAVFYNNYKGETSSFHLGDDYISIDISISDIPQETIKDVENIANDCIFRNLEVTTQVVNNGNFDKFPLRKQPPASEEVRIVEIDNTDYSPCCGTHVKRTGEIGIIKIIKTEKYKGLTRVYLKCGKRALLDFQNKTDIVSELGKHLSVPENELILRVKNEGAEIKDLTKQLNEAKDKISENEAKEIIEATASDLISISFDSKSLNDLQLLSKQILIKGDYITVFASSPDKKLFLAHNGSHNLDFGKQLKETLKSYNGKGGGSPKQAQAAFETLDDLSNYFNLIKNYCNSNLK